MFIFTPEELYHLPPQGLVVPVVRGVEGMNFTDIEKAINELGEKVGILLVCASHIVSHG